jgi:hypothetical protein
MAQNGLISSGYFSLLQITDDYCSILSIEIITAGQCSLLQITANYFHDCLFFLIFSLSNGSITTSLLLHYYTQWSHYWLQ